MRFLLLAVLAISVSTGCARMVVRKDPGPRDSGIRFYRPKPYLFVGPAPAEKADAESGLTPIAMKVEYLPDYSEEYSIRVTPGLGQAELNVTLQDGWNLTTAGAKTDQRYAEIISSVADLAGAVAPRSFTAHGTPSAYADKDVPLGYYEAVLGCAPCGSKQLLGWRYVGFLPCLAMPVKPLVQSDEQCLDRSQLYAIVFEGSTLKMRRLADLCECPLPDAADIRVDGDVPVSTPETLPGPAASVIDSAAASRPFAGKSRPSKAAADAAIKTAT